MDRPFGGFFPSDSVTLVDVDEPPELRDNPHWRTAVWALRVGYLALVVAIVGVILVVTGSTPWVLAAGWSSGSPWRPSR